jgi:large subunit ribosomal protein L24
MHIRVDDTVEVIAGDDRGHRGKVLRVDSQRNPQGGRLSLEMPIQVSNVLLVCDACGQKTRTGVRYENDGSKVRYCKKCGAGIGQISPAKAQDARK